MERELNKKTSNDEFVITPFFDNIIERTERYLNSGYPVHFTGPSGVGKTSMAMHIAKRSNRPVTMIRGHHELSNKDLLGQQYGMVKKEIIDNYIHSVYKREQEIRPLWINGDLIEAVKNGHMVIYDEFTRSRPETNNIFLSLLEERILPVYGKGAETYINCHPDFTILFTSNPEEYAGTFHTQDALMDRLITLNLEPCDERTEVEILTIKAGLDRKDATKIVRFISKLRSMGKGSSPSLRSSLIIASLVKNFSIPVMHKNKHYQTVCLDVLTRPMKQAFPDLSHQSVQELILKEMLLKEEKK